ncbi:hypothetical protein KDE12_04770 [Campylobacter sp. faydin G-105]|uniref:MATE family efflux transporter n=1 Tax=Campylobacter anatolicus TaxID=2829105 RepID=UPI001B9E9C57|nr:MATE family efflux transporter [Campylobacter anatolicus]MBR8462169.1 hypothetical protein [Campylobacter anatolicus]
MINVKTLINKLILSKYTISVFIGWLCKIVSLLLAFLNIRLMFGIVGVEGYALFSILSSLMAWFILINLGMPIAIQNIIAKYRVNNIDRKQFYSNLMFLIFFILLLSIPIDCVASYLVAKFLINKYLELISFIDIFLILYMFILNGLILILCVVLFAERRSIYPNIYPAIISIYSTIVLMIMRNFDMDISFVFVVYTLSYLFVFILSIYQSIGFIKPKYDKSITYEIFLSSRQFFIFLLLSTCVLCIDYIIAAKFLNDVEIVKYNFVSKIFNVIPTLHSILLATSFSNISESFQSKNIKHIVSILKQNIIIGFIITFIVSVVFLIFNEFIISLLSGRDDLQISYTTIYLAIGYMIIRNWSDAFGSALQASNNIAIINYIIPLQALINIFFQYVLVDKFGINGIFMALSISFLATVCIFLPITLTKRLNSV